MVLRRFAWRVLPAVVAATFLLALGASAGQRHRVVKRKRVAKHHLRRKPARRTHQAKTREVRYRRVRRRAYHHYYRSRIRRQYGPSSNRIDQIQKALERSGYYQGDPTGRWDSSTIEAMKNFQQAHGIQPTGKIDATSLQKLGLGSDVAGVAPPRPILPQNTNKDDKSVGEGR